MATTLLSLVETHAYQRLFLEHLRWSRPDMTNLSITLDEDRSFTAVNVSSYKGLRVWVCPEMPNSADQAALDRAIAKQSTDRIVIFHNEEKQVWRWPARIVKGSSTTTRLTSHIHISGKDNPKLLDRLNRITLDASEDLSATAVIDRVKQAFDVETEKESKRASKLMASMYDALTKAGAPEHDISVTLARILFLMFGDDTDMWDADLFQNFIINHTNVDGSDLAERINELFEYLDTDPDNVQVTPVHLKGFKYVNGGIFSEPIELDAVGPEMRATILDACTTDWSDISPAIFGSMFQSVRNAETRREFGEHYTSEKDILRTLNPLFLDELRQEFLDASNAKVNSRKRLRALRNRLAKIQFLDPACGCGNFIIIAYRELRLLEIAIVEKLREVSGGKPVFTEGQTALLIPGTQPELTQDNLDTVDDPSPVVTLDNYYGIEIDEWPAKIAETAMFLTDQQCDLQMQKRLGYSPERLPISRQATIVSGSPANPSGGNALKLNWKEIVAPGPDSIIAGNPPFIGMAWMDTEQRSHNREVFAALPEAKGERTGRLDYVACWYAKAVDYMRGSQARVAFVSTNSITQGDQARALDPILRRAGIHIDFAHRTFKWQSEATGAATVHCVIIGMSAKGRDQKVLFDYPQLAGNPVPRNAHAINMYLLDSELPAPLKRRAPFFASMPKMTKGSQATDGGQLIIENVEELVSLQEDPTISGYVRAFRQGRDMLNGTQKWCLWFDGAELEDLQLNSGVVDRLERVVEARLKSPTESVRRQAATPHLFTQRRQPQSRYLALPEVSSEDREYIPMAFFEPDVIAGNKLIHIDSCPEWLFGVLQSGIFMVWLRTFAGRLESRISISPDLAYCAFPFPELSLIQREAISDVACKILEVRKDYAKTLAVLYKKGKTPEQLISLHDKLDATVKDAFDIYVEDEMDVAAELLRRHHVLSAK